MQIALPCITPGDPKAVATWARELNQPVAPGIVMSGIGNWSCPLHKLYGFSTRRKLEAAIARKLQKAGAVIS
jgi:hypothetical protein